MTRITRNRGPLEKKFHKGAVELVKGAVSEYLC